MKKVIITIVVVLSLVFISCQSNLVINSEEAVYESEYKNSDFNSFLKGNLSYSDEPMITFLTPGYGSYATTWGISAERNVIEDYSIISYMQRRGADIYIVSESNEYKKNVENDVISYSDSKLGDIKVSQASENGTINYYGKRLDDITSLDKIVFDSSRPIVIVFNPLMGNEGHDIYDRNNDGLYTEEDDDLKVDDSKSEAYNELESVVNAVIYKYMLDSGTKNICPKINMIGHSRGGLINMIYSLEHPNVVDTLVSIGTPYNGSNLGEIPGAVGILSFLNSIKSGTEIKYEDILENLDSNKYPECTKDVLNNNLSSCIKKRWNEQENNSTKLVAVGTSMSFGLVEDMLNSINVGVEGDELSDYVFNNIITNIFNKFKDFINASYLNIDEKEEFIDKYDVRPTLYRTYQYIDSSSANMGMYPWLVDGINYFRRIFGYEYSIYLDCLSCLKTSCECAEETQTLIDVLEDLIQYIAGNSVYDPTIYGPDEIGEFVFLDDFYVDLDSQTAKGYNNATKYEKVLTTYNINYGKLTIANAPPAGHNVEQKDEDIIKCVLTNISLGPNDNGFIVNENNEIIGYNYEKAVHQENGQRVLIFNESDFENSSLIDYVLSPKFFGMEYNLAQVSNYYSVFNGNVLTHNTSDKIDKIVFNMNLILKEDSLMYLKDQVVYEKNDNAELKGYNNTKYFIENNSLYSAKYEEENIVSDSKTLVKFGNNGKKINYFTLKNVSNIADGAFFCQPIKEVIVDTPLKSIGDYAFYGCTLLEKIDYSSGRYSGLESVGECAFHSTYLYNTNRNLVVLGFLVKYLEYGEIFQTSAIDNITGIAPGAITNHDELKTIVFDDMFIKIMPKAFCDIEIEGIFFYFVDPVTSEPFMDIDENAFVRVGVKSVDSNGATSYNYDLYATDRIVFRDQTAKTTIELDIKYTDGTSYNGTTIIDLTHTNSNYTIDLSNYNKDGKTCIGLYPENITKSFDELYQEANIWEFYNKTVYAFLECASHNMYSFFQNDFTTHYNSCSGCDYSMLEEHTLGNYVINNEYGHISTCSSCFYEKRDLHSYDLNLTLEISDDELFNREYNHKAKCDYCEYYIHKQHEFTGSFVGTINEVTHEKQCDVCDYSRDCFRNVNISITSGGKHLLTCTSCDEIVTISNHEYLSLDYEMIDIDICLYCGYHICNGIIGEVTNDVHSVWCYYCGMETINDHVFTNQTTAINENSNIETGYHTIQCDICNQFVSRPHYYDMLSDNHTLECSICDATHIIYHTEALSMESTDYQHVTYCDFCQYYYYTSHHFAYDSNAGYTDSGHYVFCSDCGYVKIATHTNDEISIGDEGHLIKCKICGYEKSIAEHTLTAICTNSVVHNHYLSCNSCGYTTATEIRYEVLHEYEHSAICTKCNTYMTEDHYHDCTIIDGDLHLYKCEKCDVEYEMPHYVNDQYSIYYRDETYYVIICHYCGYEGLIKHQESNCPCEGC